MVASSGHLERRMNAEHFDVLIMGAGLSGIGAAYHLQKHCPRKRYIILEQRQRIGGTWDLFRYPGVRSDSDMLTMGYSFRPWTSSRAIAPGDDIRNYIADTARDAEIDRHILFHHRIERAEWSSEDAMWTVTAVRQEPDRSETPSVNGGQDARAPRVTFTCNFLWSCAGYYRYASGYLPDFPEIGRFRGRVVHPQDWPEDLDYAGKRVIIIGSGATAVTLLPALAKTAAHVTMLQRSPTYIVSMPEQDKIFNRLRRVLPLRWAYGLSRWKNIAYMMYAYNLAQRFPNFVKTAIVKMVSKHLGAEYDVATHFTPRYNPWEQRLCLVPDSDFFLAIKAGRASVETGQIERFTESGIRMQSGAELEADIVITATGLALQALGGAEISVNGQRIDLSKTLAYKGVMFSGVPNLAAIFGYINASWTLKADLISTYVCRLLKLMDRKGVRQVTPRSDESPVAHFVEKFTPGYMQRAVDKWPKQAAKAPWRVHQNYLRDIWALKWSPLDDGGLEFSNPKAVPSNPILTQAAQPAK